MAKKRTKNKSQVKSVEKKTTSTSTRAMQALFIIFSALIVLSMILSAIAKY